MNSLMEKRMNHYCPAMTNKQVVIHIDPAIGSTNLGDEIISDAISVYLRKMFNGSRIICIGSRDVGAWSRRIMAAADYIFFGGSNALSANPVFGYRQFAVGFLQHLGLRNVVLMGVGWWQYQNSFGPLAPSLYRRMLRKDIIHSVRDEYAKNKLSELGLENVINTACPTMWSLVGFDAAVADNVVVTLTDYNRDYERDVAILNGVLKKFDRVFFWPQGTDDEKYLQTFRTSVNLGRIGVLKPNLYALDEALGAGASYVGTRLHAGIRALQHKCATYIVPIDNRSIEIAKTGSLPLISPQLESIELGAVYGFVHTQRPEVKQFVEQFR